MTHTPDIDPATQYNDQLIELGKDMANHITPSIQANLILAFEMYFRNVDFATLIQNQPTEQEQEDE